jgi:hypothetical protein
VTVRDTGAPLLTGKLVCNASVAGKALRHAESFKAGKARLSFVVPKRARGRLLRVAIKVTAAAVTAGHAYTHRVR